MGFNARGVRDSERRRKRVITPIIYLLAEAVLAWLVLSLIQLKFQFQEWSVWAIFLFILWEIYSIAKTIHIYNRQKSYEEDNEK